MTEVTVHSAFEVTLPPGKYVIGDPCYGVPDESWMDLLETSDFFETTCYGRFKKEDGTIATVVAFSTMYGDGVYFDASNREYGVDAGLIGIIPLEDLDSKVPDGTHVVVFNQPVLCKKVDGWLMFGHVEINTDDTHDTDDSMFEDSGFEDSSY